MTKTKNVGWIILAVVLVAAMVLGVLSQTGFFAKVDDDGDGSEIALTYVMDQSSDKVLAAWSTNETLGILAQAFTVDGLEKNTAYRIEWTIDTSVYDGEQIKLPVDQNGKYCMNYCADYSKMGSDLGFVYNACTTTNQTTALQNMKSGTLDFATSDEGNMFFSFWHTPLELYNSDIELCKELAKDCLASIQFKIYRYGAVE